MYIAFVVLGIIGAIVSIISFIGLSYLGYLDSDKITSARAVVNVVFSTPQYKVNNWNGGERRSDGGAVDKPIIFSKSKLPILMLRDGRYQSKFIDESIIEATELFSQSIFPKAIQMKDVKKSDFIQFKVGCQPTYGEMHVINGTVELYMNDTKTIYTIPAQLGVKDVNGSIVSARISR